MKIKLLNLLGTVALLSSCASMQGKFEKEKVKNIGKVAIVSVEIQQKMPTDNLGLGKLKSSISDVPDSESQEMQNMIVKVTETLSGQLQQRTNWKVLTQKEVVSNATYKKIVDEKMSGFRRASVLAGTHETIIPKGMLDSTNFATLTTAERTALTKALGVDALVEIAIVNGIEQSAFSLGHLTGDGDFALKGTARLQVFDKTSEDPVWRSQYIPGDETESTDVLSKSMSKRQKLSTLAEKASNSATQKVVDTFIQ